MQITNLPDHLKRDAAAIYWDAFSDKLGKILGPRKRGVFYFNDIIQTEQAIAALSDDGKELLGLAGFDLGNGGVIGGGLRELCRHYGWFGGLWRGIALELFARPVGDDVLQMDGITVNKNARGQGVGTALLNAIYDKARAEHKTHILLDVIDTNPRARALYEREGFEVISTSNIGPLKRIFSFSTSYKMRKTL